VTWIKICGLTSIADAEWALECGANALGVVFEPSSPRSQHRDDMRGIQPGIAVAVYGPLPESGLRPDFGGIQYVVGREEDRLPRNRFRCQRPQPGELAADVMAEALAADVMAEAHPPNDAARRDFVVLDAYSPDGYGGTGKRLDLEFAADFVRLCPFPVVLAGGLTPDTVGAAIERVRPFGVDVSSGVEAEIGRKDRRKVLDFCEAVRAASSSRGG